MVRPIKPAEEVAAVRQELLDVARALFEEDGVEAMSFRAIATRAGCSHTKPYTYFDSKADIIDALRVQAYEWIHGVLSAAAAMHEDPIDALRALVEAYVRACLERPRMHELLYTAAGAADESEPALYAAKVAGLGVCRDVIAAAVEAGRIDLAVDPLTAAHLFWGAAHGYVNLQIGGFFVVGRTVDDIVPIAVQALIDGLSREVAT